LLLQLWLPPGWLFCLPLRRAQRYQPRASQVCVGLVVQAATHLVDCSLVHSLPWRPIGCGQANPGPGCGGFLRNVGSACFRHQRWGLRTESLIGAYALGKASRLCLTERAAPGVRHQSRGRRSAPRSGARSGACLRPGGGALCQRAMQPQGGGARVLRHCHWRRAVVPQYRLVVPQYRLWRLPRPATRARMPALYLTGRIAGAARHQRGRRH
jgi:hypothetical protein